MLPEILWNVTELKEGERIYETRKENDSIHISNYNYADTRDI